MKKLIKRLILNKLIAKILIKPILKIHTLSYKLAGKCALVLNNNIHPKHRIIKYKEWFFSNIKPQWVILDIGCNVGLMAELLSSKQIFVYGIDIDEKNIKEAEKERQKTNIKYIHADATKYNFSSIEGVDCIILSNILEHIDNRIDFLKTLINNVKWNDKGHKRFLIRVPMIDREWIVIYKKELGVDYKLDPNHFIEYTFDGFKDELKQANIDILNYQINFGEILAVSEAR